MKKHPLVSVITLSYNNLEKIECTIRSLLEQNYPNIEYIISDDCSDNYNEKYIKDLVNKFRKDNIKRFVLLKNKENLGTVKNINKAIKHSTGEYVIYLSSGDYFFDKDVINKIIKRMLKNESKILSYSRIEYDDNKIIKKIPLRYFYKLLSQVDTPIKQYKALVTSRYYDFASGSAVCIKKEIINKLNFYDENYILWEDGPFFAKSNVNNIAIDKAYDICGIYYKTGGVSAKNRRKKESTSKLEKDALMFYKKVLKENSLILSRYEKRRIKYSIDKLSIDNNINRTILLLKYMDVVFENQIIKLKYNKALKKEREYLLKSYEKK